MRVLLIGGAGYVGSHIAVALLDAGHDVVVIDDLSNSSRVAIERVQQIGGAEIPFLIGDIREEEPAITFLHREGPIDAIVLLAGFKSVSESVSKPLKYYEVNLGAALATLRIAARLGVDRVVFSSSATVYGNPRSVPIDENALTGMNVPNPYGRTKFFIEEMLKDAAAADTDARYVILRYFNPVGSHPSGLIGEDPLGVPTNLMPIVSRVASGRQPYVEVFGGDYPTPDGTGLRDYVDVNDLARGHVAAIEHAELGAEAFNLGSGVPKSVLELIAAFEHLSGRSVPYRVGARRAGDVPVSYADPAKANERWGWCATRTLEDACREYWHWQTKNPLGYPPSIEESP